MTSKSSFWVDLKINARRRTWNIALFAVGFFFLLPVSLIMSLSSTVKYTSELYLAQRLMETAREILSANPVTVFFVTIFAMIAAIHGFSYLYSRSKTDMYLSVPVKIERRFAVIVTNSMLMFIIPYAVFFVISLIIAGTYGVSSTYIIKTALTAFCMNIVYYISIYAITVIAVMLTGNLVVTVLGAGTLICYENGVKFLLNGLFSSYFRTYSALSDDIFYTTWVSPLGVFVRLFTDFTDALMAETAYGSIVSKGVLHLIVLAAVYMVIAFVLYKIRPIEACHKSMAFPKTKAVIKRFVMVPSALLFALFFESASGRSLGGAVFGLIAGTILVHAIMQAIYEQDIRAVFKDKRSLIYAGVISAVMFGIFRFDLLGYDKYVPNENKLERGAVSLNLSFINMGNYFNDEYGYISDEDYIIENMDITDTQLLVDIAKTAADEFVTREDDEERELYGGEEDTIAAAEEYYSNRPSHVSATVRYTMNNGKNVYRWISFDYRKNEELLNRLFADKDFKENIVGIYDENFERLESSFEAGVSNGIDYFEIESVQELTEAYKKDFMEMTFSDIMDKLSKGYVDFTADVRKYSNRESERLISYSMPLFDTFENTLAVIKNEDIDIDRKLTADDVTKITIDDYSEEGNGREIEITDKKQIAEILKNMCNDTELSYSALRSYGGEYYINVSYVSDGYQQYVQGHFIDGKMPDFVK